MRALRPDPEARCGPVRRGAHPRVIEEAQELARQSDVCLVVGTSAVVCPAASVPELVARGGGTVCQFDLESTDLTHLGHVRWFVQGPAEETLPRLLDLVQLERGAGRR